MSPDLTDKFLTKSVGACVDVYLVNGVKLVGTLLEYSTDALLVAVKSNSQDGQLVFRSNVSSIKPSVQQL